MKKIVLILYSFCSCICVFSQVNLSNGLVAYYPFNGNTFDASGNNNHVIFNNATLTADRFGNPNRAYYFNGINSYMRVANSPSLNPTNVTLMAIVKPMGFYKGPCHGNVIINKGDDDFNIQTGYRMRFDDGYYVNFQNCANTQVDTLHQGFYADFGSNGGVASAPGLYINKDQWYCVVFTFDGSTSKIYIDGVLAESRNSSTPYLGNSTDVFFGRLNNSQFPYWFNGVIDDIRIYNRALTATEVSALCGPPDCGNWLATPAVPSYIQAGDLDISGDKITVEALINRTTPYTGGNLWAGDVVSKHDNPGDANYLLRPNSAEITTTNGYFITPEICPIELNKTYHIAMVYDGAVLKFYRNGFLMSQVNATGNLFQNDWPLRIGYYFNQLFNTNFIGYTNEVRIWNVARTQAELQTYMYTSLPNPTTQAGLQAYYQFNNLLNKQGNALWNGTLGGSALINQSNPTCASFSPDSCCVIPSGTLSGSSICAGSNGELTFTATNGTAPFTLTYTDGTNVFTQTNVLSGVPFTVPNLPLSTTSYTLQTIQSGSCAPSAVNGVSATIIVNQCTLCTGSLGDPVVNISFGSGNNPGQPLSQIVPGASTTLSYVQVNGNPAVPAPAEGQYTITNNVPQNALWFSGMTDHTPNDNNGFMAFYNSQQTAGLEFYRQTVNSLCASGTYEFAAWIANCVNPAVANGIDPDITLRIEKTDGTLIASFNTGPISESTVFSWKQYGFYFTVPVNTSSVVLKMINNSVGGNQLPGNDIAIDDITFRPCGPTVNASFNSLQVQDTLTICESSPYTLYGKSSGGYVSPSYRWQTSNDGVVWTDLPNTNTTQLTLTSSAANVLQNIWYRMITAESANINSANCRVSSNKILLIVRPRPNGGLSGDTVCLQAQGFLTFNSNSNSSPFDIVYSNGSQISNATNISNGTKITIGPMSTDSTFTLISIRDNFGCVRQTGFNPQSATVSIRKINFKEPTRSFSVCENSSVQLNGNNGTQVIYSWSPSTFLNNSSIQNPVSIPSTSIDYLLTITEPVCQYDTTFSVSINVNPNPIVEAEKSNDIDCSNLSAILTARGAASYTWTPVSSLNNPSSPNPTATATTTTTYTLKGTDLNGCSSTDTVTVKVTNGGTAVFAVPNAFTPNGDGRNDCFGIQRWGGVTIKEFSIFNRWGQMIFTTKDPGQCWDGRVNGQLQDPGGFAYVIKASSFCGEIVRTGTVLLIR